MGTSSIEINSIAKYVEDQFLHKEQRKDLLYHNWDHTQRVLDSASTIGEAEQLEPDTLENLKIAALFHDVAYRDNG
ncbi:MAG: HD domain-containing protein, partial [Flavobacteriales bacterium]|nr:HD domain-containing protein [Flavobacteriales bacterium]